MKLLKLFLITLTAMISGQIFAQDSNATTSGLLPIIYVNTTDGEPIVSKETYLTGTYYIDANGISGFENVGSIEEPLPMQIRGRGNSTWAAEKKPYKLKLNSKTALLGMPKNKHWALMAFYGYATQFSNYLAFATGRYLGMGWQPHMQPVELVLNGSFEGVYYLTETIKIDKNRLNITEQADEETNPELIDHGWLVEVDNYVDECQIAFQETPRHWLKITYHTPEVLSQEQNNWLLNEFIGINNAIYSKNKNDNSWENYIDAESLAKYFILQELFDNTDGFIGSFYLNKDLSDSKWVCGPIWDVGLRMRTKTDFTIYMPDWGGGEFTETYGPHWIKELLKFPHFVEIVRSVWNQYFAENPETLLGELDTFAEVLNGALENNYLRWPNEYNYSSAKRANAIKIYFNLNRNFLDQKINTKIESLELDCYNLNLEPGETYDLIATKYPSEAIDPIVFISDNEDVATVDKNGKISVIGGGEATISAICGDITKDCKIYVEMEKCAKPEISINPAGELVVTCDTPDATIHTTIHSFDHKEITHCSGEGVPMLGQYLITARASAPGKAQSEPATAFLTWSNPEFKQNTEADIVFAEKKDILLVKSEGKTIKIEGTHNGENIKIFSLEGSLIYDGMTSGQTTWITDDFIPGNIYIITINDKTIKYLFN